LILEGLEELTTDENEDTRLCECNYKFKSHAIYKLEISML
jgi:hypothetical protein